MAERRTSLEWERGTVANANANGVKLDGDSEWRNWSQYVPEQDRSIPAKGTKVRVGQDNRGFIREIQDEHGDKLGTATGGGGRGSGSMTPEDQWRITLLACLHSASRLMTIMADEQLGGQRRSEATYQLALHWARQIWVQPMPEKPRTAQGDDDAGR